MKWQWNLRILAKGTTSKDKIILLDKTQDSRTGASILSQIQTSQNTAKLMTYTDIDGTNYSVLFNSLDENSWVVNSTDGSEGDVSITLIQA